MNTVPLAPRTIVRAPGWPCDHTSALSPSGSLILSSGSLSSGVAVGGVGYGRILVSWPLPPGLVRSIGLKPGWAIAAVSEIANAAADAAASAARGIMVVVMV